MRRFGRILAAFLGSIFATKANTDKGLNYPDENPRVLPEKVYGYGAIYHPTRSQKVKSKVQKRINNQQKPKKR